MSMLLWDDRPLPAEIKKTGTLLRIRPMWHEGFSSFDTTRFFGVVRIEGKDCVFRADGDSHNGDLAIAKAGDTIEVGSSRFGDDVTYLRSSRIVWDEDDEHFRDVLRHLTTTTQARGKVLRTGSFMKRTSSSYTNEQCRVAVLIETLAIKGVISVTVEDKPDLIVAQPGDEMLVSFDVSSYTPHAPYLKSASLLKLAE
jgi:hypothetical protein